MVEFLLVRYEMNLWRLAHLTAKLLLESILQVYWILKHSWLEIEVLVLITVGIYWHMRDLVLHRASLEMNRI